MKGQRQPSRSWLCCFHSFAETMRVICIQKDWEVEFLAQTSHQGSKLIGPDELPLSFRRTRQYRNLEFACCFGDRFQQN